MENIVLGIHHLPFEDLQDPFVLHEIIYLICIKIYT